LILEAFSQRLHQAYQRDIDTEDILHGWLLEILQSPGVEGDLVAKVIHTEVGFHLEEGDPVFFGKSPTGETLLKTLEEYCKSYEHWQFSRWLHHLRASDFPIH
jgi:hypothetical protein